MTTPTTSPMRHQPVLLHEVLTMLVPQPGDRLLDATVGHGGHAAAYLAETTPDGVVVGLDADEAALEQAAKVLAPYRPRFTLRHANFSQLKDSVQGGGILPTLTKSDSEPEVPPQFDHVLFDLGIGSHQLADATRGFSFQQGASLRMRYGAGELPPAAVPALNVLAQRLGRLPDVPDILIGLRAEELADILRTYGEERYAGRIANALSAAAPTLTTSPQLAEVVSGAVPAVYRHGRIHPATRTFQALRLAVNRELEVLQAALPQAVELLAPHGKLAVISFHSLEDRMVKQFFRQQSQSCVCPPEQPECTCDTTPVLHIVTRRPIRASEEEIAENPRSRSAKLRVAQKVPARSG